MFDHYNLIRVECNPRIALSLLRCITSTKTKFANLYEQVILYDQLTVHD